MVKRVVVLGPIAALDVWDQQIDEHFALPAAVKIVGEPLRVTASGVKEKGVRFYLINYDKISRRGKNYVYQNDYVRAIERWRPDLVVLDESHRCKAAGAIRSQALWQLVRRLRKNRKDDQPFVYLLTGTPNPKGWIDLFAQFRIMNEAFGTSKAGFEERYCRYGLGKRRFTIVKYHNRRSCCCGSS